MGKFDAKWNNNIPSLLPDMFRDGSTVCQVAALKLGISRSTYYQWKEDHPDFKEASELGEYISQAYHEQKLLDGADGMIDGFSAPARIFYMKNGFRKDYAVEHDQKDNKPSALESLIGALSDKVDKK
jgi:transposase